MKNKVIACIIGVACHFLFFTAITLMAYMLFWGMTRSILPINHWYRAINVILLLQFPILHSFFLSPKGRTFLESLFPKEISHDLLSTTYSLIASIQLLLVFLLWTPNSHVWYAPTGTLFYLWSVIYCSSWILLVIALSEAGLALHTGFLGWSAVVQGKKPEYPKPAFVGLHKSCRQPIYLAFALIILTAPVWSLDHFIFASVWVSYCLIGPLFKEKRFLKMFGEEYRQYREKTSYFIPKLFSQKK